jgi:hypothetical protein
VSLSLNKHSRVGRSAISHIGSGCDKVAAIESVHRVGGSTLTFHM